MEEERWERIKTIVDTALTLSGGEKETYLSTVCRKNPEICAEIEELLRSIEESEEKQFMMPMRQDRKELVAELSDELNEALSGETLIGTTIGPYRITEQLGSGGMGTVFKAKRIDGEFHHQVAIKLIKKGVDSEENIRRFRVEREVLAGLHHPNIAQLHDGGVTEDGIPYLIMEYIDGVPIDRYCNEQQLTINQRLDLFKEVCRAIQFAHTNLVVHRDLKAQNIYVTLEGIVKILDFGVAKLLDPQLTEITLLETRPGQKFWTPQYAAPEQVKGQEITTKTDIYALGVLLHKLLTDTYPLDLEGKSLAEVEEIIKETVPSSPSQRLAVHPSKKECASYRQTTVAQLTKELQGDLDALVLKAIRKDPAYRYTSVSQLLEDIERYQSGIPLLARKGTWKYRASKFIHRHQTGLAATAIFLIAAISFTAFYTWQIAQERDRARTEATKAEQVTDFLLQIFESGDPHEAMGEELTARELLDQGVEKAAELDDQPVIQAQMLSVIGRAYRAMGDYEKAQSLSERALSLRKNVLGPDHIDIASSMKDIGWILKNQGEYKTAESFARKALAMQRRLLGEDDIEVAQSLNVLAMLLMDQGDYEEAEPHARESLAIRQKLLDDEHEDVVTSMNNLALLLHSKGNYAEAEPFYRRVVAVDRKQLEPMHPYLANDLHNLAFLLMDKGDYEAAEPIFREALSITKEVYGNDHPLIATRMSALARLFQHQERYEEAERLLRQSLDIDRRFRGEQHPNTISDLKNLGVLLYLKGDYETSEQHLRNALTLFREQLGEEHPRIAVSQFDLARLLKRKGEYVEAERYFREALVMQRKLLDENHMEIAASLVGLSRLLVDQNRAEEAEPYAREAFNIRRHTLPDDDWRVAETNIVLGACLTSLNRYEKAESKIMDGYNTLKKKRGMDHRFTQEALERLVTLYEKWDKPEQAKIYRNELASATKTRE